MDYLNPQNVQHIQTLFHSQDTIGERRTHLFYGATENYEMSPSEFLRQTIDDTVIKPIILVNPVNDEVLAAALFSSMYVAKVGSQ